MLNLKAMTVMIDSVAVVHEISLKIEPGSLIMIQGKNGSGKSSLLNALAGHPFYNLSGSEFIYNDVSLLESSALERSQAGLFLIMQHPPALPGVRVSTFLQESFRALNLTKTLEEYQQRLTFALEFLQLSSDFITKPVHEHFSGGEKKRCELLQLMVLQPTLVLLDEVDSGLDSAGIELLISVIKWYKKIIPQAIIIMVTHSSSLVEKLPQSFSYIMDQGRLQERS